MRTKQGLNLCITPAPKFKATPKFIFKSPVVVLHLPREAVTFSNIEGQERKGNTTKNKKIKIEFITGKKNKIHCLHWLKMEHL